MKCNVIFLSGTSSSGKSTLRKKLLEIIGRANVIGIEVDAFLKSMSEETFTEDGNFKKVLPYFVDSFHKVISSYAKNDFLVIVDSLFQEESWFENYLQNTSEVQTFWVCVYCPLEELNRRESERGDRKLGLAASQYDKVHRWPTKYDLKLDTSKQSPGACAEEILNALALHCSRKR